MIEIPEVTIWKDTKKAPPGPNELQKRYFISYMPPDKRPHWHTRDVLLSIGGYGSGKSFGAISLAVDSCLTIPNLTVYAGGLDLPALKRVILKDITSMFTIKEPWDHPAILNRLGDKQDTLRFFNGSSLACVNLTQFIKLTGANAGMFIAEEPHLFPDGEETYNQIFSRLRDTPPEIRQLVLCTNPEKTKSGWMNQTFDLAKFDGVDTSNGPVEKQVGKPCTCQYCTNCLYARKLKIKWEQDGDRQICPKCMSINDYWTWEGKKYYCPGDQLFTRVIKSETTHNPHLPSDYLQGMAAQYDEKYFDIMVKGKTNTDLRDDYVFGKYSEKNLLPKPLDIDWNKEVYWTLDFNQKPQCSAVCQIDNINGERHLVVKREIVMYGPTLNNPYGGANARDVAKQFVDLYKDYYKGEPIYIYGDPNGFHGQTERELTRYQQIVEELESGLPNAKKANGASQIMICVTEKHIPFKERLDNTNDVLENGILLLNPGELTEHLQASFEQLMWDENKQKFKADSVKSGDHNAKRSMNRNRVYAMTHPSDAVGYLIYNLFPILVETGLTRSFRSKDGTSIVEKPDGSVEVTRPNADPVIENKKTTLNDEYKKAADTAKTEIERIQNQSLGSLLRLPMPKKGFLK